MKKVFLKLFFALIIGLLISCASDPERKIQSIDLNATAAYNQTEIFIHRTDDVFIGYISVFINDSLKAEIERGKVEKIIIPNGNHEIHVAWNAKKISASSDPIQFRANGGRLDFRANLIAEIESMQIFSKIKIVHILTLVQAGDVSQSVTGIITSFGIEGALARAAEEVTENFTDSTRIAIVYITAQDRGVMEYIAGELEHILRRHGYIIIDRSELDRVRAEQQFGVFGEVDDNTAARIGKITGANIVITGRVDGEGDLRRLRLRALDTTSAQVIGTASERI